MRVAILDDYQGVALRMADWRSLHGQAVEDIRAFLDGKVLRPLNQLPADPAPLG
ncbi:hypothetical protein [Sorangium atrum]|uniref:Uncharacterized protein n=1 Tax=Sorangium atrum TaxID=2995308 RepID=A0ABT5CCU7_9BACT|nr:hypothetical protein [Sorangium aterium]MDC0683438.1 hypothetical protein [Sorangium aterium]